jgi:hypothetical protein
MKLFVCILIFFSQGLFAANNVRLPTTITTTASDDVNFSSFISLLVTNQGSAVDESSALEVYIPIDETTGGVGTPKDQELAYDGASFASMPKNTALDAAQKAHFKLSFKVTTDSSTTYYVRAAIKNDNDYINLKLTNPPDPYTSLGSYDNQTAIVSLEEICSAAPDECDEINNSVGTNDNTFQLFLYLTTSPTNTNSGTVTVSSLDGDDGRGIYFDLKLSTIYPVAGNEERLNISTVSKGDELMTIVYEELGGIDNMPDDDGYKTVVFKVPNLCAVDNGVCNGNKDTYKNANYSALTVYQEFDFARSGTLKIKKLQNNVASCFVVALKNKYGFLSPMSNIACATPLPIEVFIEEMQCYLLSAGFGEEHFIIDYFRSFRDRILLQNPWGKLFVNFYYSTAPKIAPYIYQNKFLSFVVQGFSFVLYFIFNYFMIFFFLLSLVLVAILSTYRKKFRL